MKTILLFLLTIVVAILSPVAFAQTEKVLYTFCPTQTCSSGMNPYSGVVFDAAGNLYGTTEQGGRFPCGPHGAGCGTVFELTPRTDGTWKETTLYKFCPRGGCYDGRNPYDGVIVDKAGNLHGTTYGGGGIGNCCGAVFHLTKGVTGKWKETATGFLVKKPAKGLSPYAGVISDAAGNLYGTTVYGGMSGNGVVFELTPERYGLWARKILHDFSGSPYDGQYPYGRVVFDTAGNLYGTTMFAGDYGAGTIFELTPLGGGGWSETVLHSFPSSGKDGLQPQGSLVIDGSGNLYGTTFSGGDNNDGVVFEMTPLGGGQWSETVLHSFAGSDGFGPTPNLTLDSAGNLYGTTQTGGAYQRGTVFELSPAGGGQWVETILYSFCTSGGFCADGSVPNGALTFDGEGNLYGTTLEGGNYQGGVVFEIVRSKH